MWFRWFSPCLAHGRAVLSLRQNLADRLGLRYPSDLTDDEWAIVAPMIAPARHGGRKRSVNVRPIVVEVSPGLEWDFLRAVDVLYPDCFRPIPIGSSDNDHLTRARSSRFSINGDLFQFG